MRSSCQQLSTFMQSIDLETPYSRYATVNFVARPEDREPIDAIVAERQLQITDLTQQIERVDDLCRKLHAVQARLKERRSRVEESQRFHRGLTCAVRRLSPETLAEIFCHCFPEDPPVPSAKDIPLVLTRVCQRWRSIAMGTPQLWSSLRIPLHKVAEANYRFQYDTWLARAKNLPLVLLVDNDRDIRTLDVAPGSLDWLRGLVARCLELRWRGRLLECLLTGRAAVRLLEGLDIDLQYSHITSANPFIAIASNARKLRSVRLWLPVHVASIDRITLPWAQLTMLDMHGVGLRWPNILRLFETCTSLQDARFSLPYEDGDVQAVVPGSVINRSLKFLVIEVWASRLGGLLFGALVLSSLEELEVRFNYYCDNVWPHAQFASFLTRSGCPLKRLEVCGKNSVSDYLSEYRALLPSCTLEIL
ncbi:hypothetical protein F5I97DRAFT_1954273 [Phlebopus sp. FC_14]|nr:hypothetical protein F5I97DRAFT_1954273 [Phlebopus sp. FC_14]